MATGGAVAGDISRAFVGNRPSAPSIFSYRSTNFPRSSEVEGLFPLQNLWWRFYPPLDLMTKIHLCLTHSLNMTRRVPHLTRDKSHDATWNHPGMPHHHSICRLIQSGSDTSTWETSVLRHLAFKPPSYILDFSWSPESWSSEVLELLPRTSAFDASTFGLCTNMSNLSEPRSLRVLKFLARYLAFDLRDILTPCTLHFPE
jgi:hypothetical protein